MESLTKQLQEYKLYYSEKANKIAQYIGVPAVILGVLIGLSWISVSVAVRWYISFAWIAIIAILVYYYLLNVKLAVAMTVIMVIINLLCTWVAFPAPTTFSLVLFLVLFIGGIALCLIGHSLKKTKGSLCRYLRFIIITPLYLGIELIQTLNLEKYFELEKLQITKMPPPTKN